MKAKEFKSSSERARRWTSAGRAAASRPAVHTLQQRVSFPLAFVCVRSFFREQWRVLPGGWWQRGGSRNG